MTTTNRGLFAGVLAGVSLLIAGAAEKASGALVDIEVTYP